MNIRNFFIKGLARWKLRETLKQSLISSFMIFLVVNGESQAVECTQNQVIDSGATRVWNQLAVVTCDQNRGWYRMSENSGGEIASTCSTNNEAVSRLNQPCGASFRGWMLDRHPSLEDGRVQRRVCFSYAFECTCEFFTNIYVRNCGKFYVYRLNGVPVCNARYCGNLKNSSAEGECQFFKCVLSVLISSTRSIFRTLPTSKMKRFTKIVSGIKPVTVFVRSSIFDVWSGCG